MKDIARDLGVSVVTVSKVLRNHSDIGEETRQKVLKRMKELNYRPNLAARALVTGRTSMMGLVVPDLVHPFFGEIAKALSRVIRKKGYTLVISSSEKEPELERQAIEQLLARRVDALVIGSAQWTIESFRRIEEQETPFVLIDRSFVGFPANFVGVDDVEIGAIATEHLVDEGCRRIAHIRGPEISTASGRLQGYQRVLAKHGLSMPTAYLVGKPVGEPAEVGGYKAMQKLLQLNPRPDAVFCYNDSTAVGAMRSILDAGLKIPGDIALVGCGNLHYSQSLYVPLTSVDQNSPAIGERAAKLALSLIESKTPLRPKTILLKPKLMIRASSSKTATHTPGRTASAPSLVAP